jgi:hypothetical protein
MNEQSTIVLPPLAIFSEDAKGVDSRAAAPYASITRIRHDEKLRSFRQHTSRSTALNLNTIKLRLPFRRRRDNYYVPESHFAR